MKILHLHSLLSLSLSLSPTLSLSPPSPSFFLPPSFYVHSAHRIDVTEAQFAHMIILLVAGVLGTEFWSIEVGGSVGEFPSNLSLYTHTHSHTVTGACTGYASEPGRCSYSDRFESVQSFCLTVHHIDQWSGQEWLYCSCESFSLSLLPPPFFLSLSLLPPPFFPSLSLISSFLSS